MPGHSHAAEELVYVIEGSAIHVEDGKPERTLRPGDMAVIPPETVHRPRGGPDGARAITVRFKLPERDERDDVPELLRSLDLFAERVLPSLRGL